MKDSLRAGLEHSFSFTVTEDQLVPALYPKASELQVMPEVFATGFLVGLIEWTCIQAVNPHLDWPREQTVGIHLDLSHEAPTPPGLTVTVTVRLSEVEGRKLTFEVEAGDGSETICRGRHQRFVVSREKFDAGLEKKRAAAGTD